jgi:hypothetical protein
VIGCLESVSLQALVDAEHRIPRARIAVEHIDAAQTHAPDVPRATPSLTDVNS